jgi:hypothetical protein
MDPPKEQGDPVSPKTAPRSRYKRRGQRELQQEANALGIATRRGRHSASPTPAWGRDGAPEQLVAPAGKVAFYFDAVAPLLTCTICNNLLREVCPAWYVLLHTAYLFCHAQATTLCECLHSFCNGCIVPFLKKQEECPHCGTVIQMNNSAHKPYRGDQALQSIVDKIQQARLAMRQEAETENNEVCEVSSELDGEMPLGSRSDEHGGGQSVNRTGGGEGQQDFSVGSAHTREEGEEDGHPRKKRKPSDSDRAIEKAARLRLKQLSKREGGVEVGIVFRLNPAATGDRSSLSPTSSWAGSPSPHFTSPGGRPKLHRSHLRASDRITVFYLKQFLAQALRVKSVKQLEVRCVGAALGDDMSLEYVRRTHWRGHTDDEEIELQYMLKDP